MDSNIRALIVKKFKDSEMDLEVGRHWVDETVVLLSGFNRESTGLLDTPAILIALRDQSLLQGVRP